MTNTTKPPISIPSEEDLRTKWNTLTGDTYEGRGQLRRQLDELRSRQLDNYRDYYYRDYVYDIKTPERKTRDEELLKVFRNVFSWKEEYRYLISYEVLCPAYHNEVSSWTDDITKVDASEVEEKLEDWECDEDYKGSEELELGEEKKRKIQIQISEFQLKEEK